jgi:hypothetical protein
MSDELTADQVLIDWESALIRQGEVIEFGRQTGNDPNNVVLANCRARVKDYRPDTLVDNVKQGSVVIKAFYPDLVANSFPLPVRNTDHVIIRGLRKQIDGVDNNTGRVGMVQIFVRIMASG